MTVGDPDDYQAPGDESVSLSGMPVEAEVDQGTPMFRAVEVVELSKRQQNIARKIVLSMETSGPHGIVDGKINGQGILRKVLPMLWELPMVAEAEYDGVSVVAGESTSLKRYPGRGGPRTSVPLV